MKLSDCRIGMIVKTNREFADIIHGEPIRNARIIAIYRDVEIKYGAIRRFIHPDWIEPMEK